MIKKKAAVVLVLFVLLVFVFLLLFTDIIGIPLLWKINYNKYYMDNFYNGGTLLEIDSENNNMGVRYSKYCKNLNSIIIKDKIDPDEFFKYVDPEKLQYIYISGDIDDWSFFKKCINLESLWIEKSNFNDFSFLDRCSNLQSFLLSSDQKVLFSGIENISSLKSLSLSLKECDMLELSKINSLDSLCLINSPVYNSELLTEMNLKDLSLSDYKNADELLFVLEKSNSIPEIHFSNCNFSMSENEISKYTDRISFENCSFD